MTKRIATQRENRDRQAEDKYERQIGYVEQMFLGLQAMLFRKGSDYNTALAKMQGYSEQFLQVFPEAKKLFMPGTIGFYTKLGVKPRVKQKVYKTRPLKIEPEMSREELIDGIKAMAERFRVR